jgi:UDP-GlcNAc:undecaprenyl-phosphate/decaprenyl-phosphate GlcNAc-1-phosphate transferase
MILSYLAAYVLAFLLALYGTPIARKAAVRFGVVDNPDGRLKNHRQPVPYLGGLAIYLAVLIPLCLFYTFDTRILSVLLAGTLVLLLGLIDDFGVLTPAAKMIGQLLAVFVLIKGDVFIRIGSFPPTVNLVLTVLWLLGMANALNIIDIMDGLAAGIALCSSICLFVVAILNGHSMIAIFTISLVGSLAGFIPYNFKPAKIYMGDTGSMFLGLTLGALSIIGDYTQFNKLAFFNPLIIFGVAIFDTLFVMVLRVMQRRSPFLGSPDHFAIRLKRMGWSVKKIVLASYALATVLGSFAIWNMYLPEQRSMALYSGILLFFLFLGIGLSRIKVA